MIYCLSELAASFSEGIPLDKLAASSAEKQYIIPPNRIRYLSEISETCRTYDKWVEKQSTIARELFSIKNTLQSVDNQTFINKIDITEELKKIYAEIELSLDGQCKKILDTWDAKKSAYEQDEFIYKVRGKDVKVAAYHKTLSGNKIPRVILPKFKDWGEILIGAPLLCVYTFIVFAVLLIKPIKYVLKNTRS